MNEELYKILSKSGDVMNFNTGLYENKTDKHGTQMAKKVARKFLEFSKFCEDHNLTMKAGMADLKNIGSSTYIAICEGNRELFIIATPHDIYDITPKEPEGDEE